jgi:hypothetical protein
LVRNYFVELVFEMRSSTDDKPVAGEKSSDDEHNGREHVWNNEKVKELFVIGYRYIYLL